MEKIRFDNYNLYRDYSEIAERVKMPEEEDIYVYFRFTGALPCSIQVVCNYSYGTIEEAICFIKYAVVRPAIFERIEKYRDADLMLADPDSCFEKETGKTKEQLEKYRHYWNEINEVLYGDGKGRKLAEFIEKFNDEFAHDTVDYEVKIFYGLESFRKFKVNLMKEFEFSPEEVAEFEEITGRKPFNPERLKTYFEEHPDF